MLNEDELSKVIISGDTQAVKAHLESGGSFQETLTDSDGYGCKALELAAIIQVKQGGDPKITRLILQNSSSDIQAECLYRFASEDAYLAQAQALLEAGALVDHRHQDQTPLQMATGNGNIKMVFLLLSYKADPNAKGMYGTALELANEKYYMPAYLGMMESALRGNIKSPFDFVDQDEIKSKLGVWAQSLTVFVDKYFEQTFYVLAIEGSQLVANSEEAFAQTLARYQKNNAGDYSDQDKINDLRYSPGDFTFHGILDAIDDAQSAKFPAMAPDLSALDYSFLDRRQNDNRTEKDLLREGLILNQDILLKGMKRSNDFRIITPGHVY